MTNATILPLLLGLLISIILLLVASNYLAKLIARFPLLLYGAGVILAWTAETTIYTDHVILPYWQQEEMMR